MVTVPKQNGLCRIDMVVHSHIQIPPAKPSNRTQRQALAVSRPHNNGYWCTATDSDTSKRRMDHHNSIDRWSLTHQPVVAGRSAHPAVDRTIKTVHDPFQWRTVQFPGQPQTRLEYELLAIQHHDQLHITHGSCSRINPASAAAIMAPMRQGQGPSRSSSVGCGRVTGPT